MISTSSGTRVGWWYGCALLAFAVPSAVLLLPLSTLTRATLAPALMGLAGSWAAAALHQSARRSTGRTRVAWTLLTGSVGLWVVTRFFTAVWTVVHRTPTPRLSGLDLVLTVAVVLAVTGVCLLPGRRGVDRTGRLLALLDLVTVVANVALALWMTLIDAILHRGFVQPRDKVSLLIFVGFDVVMVTRALMLASRPPEGRRLASSLFAAGWVLFAGSDIHIMSGLANGSYQVGTVGDLGWVAGTVLLAVASRHWVDPVPDTSPSVMWRAVLLPYAVMPVTVSVCLDGAAHGAAFGVTGFVLAGVLVTAIFSRQLVTLAQNTNLVARMAEQEAQLRHLATHDPLTGLANRRLFRERLDDSVLAAQAAGQVAVIYIDLDDFKVINDTLGHLVGDELLRRTADRLSACVRGSDLAARLGGDEFAVLLTTGGENAAQAVAARLAEALCVPIMIGVQSVLVRASVGIAAGGDRAAGVGADGPSDDLLAHADLAMYAAKKAAKMHSSGQRPGSWAGHDGAAAG